MFAQLIITCILVATVAEVLCRLILRQSSFAVLSYLLAWRPAAEKAISRPASEKTTAEFVPLQDERLRHALRDRRRQLAAAQAELRLKQRTADVVEQLAQTEEDLAQVDERLAAASHPGAV